MRQLAPIVQIQAFSQSRQSGNGATVVWCEKAPTTTACQGLARQLRQSETAYLWKEAGELQIRWFTPQCEVALCGHATLAAVIALGQWNLLEAERQVILQSCSGPLPVAWANSPSLGLVGRIELPKGRLNNRSAELADSEHAELELWLGHSIERLWGSSLGYRVALSDTVDDLGALRVDAGTLPETCRQGLVLMQGASGEGFCVAGTEADYQLRFFAPGLGIDEDPVTGSAHALVADYWMAKLQRDWVVGWQPSQSCGGMRCERCDSAMIRLIGSGSVLWRGELEGF